MSLPWSAQQCEWLQALGHPVQVLAAGFARDVGEDAEPAASSPASSGALHAALLQASRQAPEAAELALRQLAVDPAALRDSPAAKRALWPRLRQLRARRR